MAARMLLETIPLGHQRDVNSWDLIEKNQTTKKKKRNKKDDSFLDPDVTEDLTELSDENNLSKRLEDAQSMFKD